MSKQLTLSSINKAHAKEFNEQKRVTLKTGDYIDLQVRFKKTSIQRFLIDYQEILEQLKEKEVDMNVIKDITFIFYMLLLRHFTSLNIIPNEVDKMVIVCEKLIDLDILEEIMNAFDPAEIEKVNNMMKQVSENSDLIGEQLGEIFAKAALSKLTQNEVEQDANIQ
ncbi:hypothetical protein [Paenibacillus cremeus]|uniref:Uncharacterized protein n=1 Tax=Paenibacillus cremeus TaxID=2163881 RepID=A0A559KCW6_9BACL|nr:hypothetical protein [Paenibacillus cremeus]TVY09971.1 hypothetical protein FPZ49_11410 [Paenibacillus cremeus]